MSIARKCTIDGCERANRIYNNMCHYHNVKDWRGKRPEYQTWSDMKSRCYNKNNTAYKNYGGRGISVCSRWINSYDNFIADMGERPEGMTLDRINNSLGYSPENCKWSTVDEQLENRRHYKSNKSGHVGVYYIDDRNKWVVRKTINGKSIYLGIYDDIEKAIKAYHDFVNKCSYCDK